MRGGVTELAAITTASKWLGRCHRYGGICSSRCTWRGDHKHWDWTSFLGSWHLPSWCGHQWGHWRRGDSSDTHHPWFSVFACKHFWRNAELWCGSNGWRGPSNCETLELWKWNGAGEAKRCRFTLCWSPCGGTASSWIFKHKDQKKEFGIVQLSLWHGV